jgi:tetratricopeptide (TPR) repeat protein
MRTSRTSITPLMGGPFESAVVALEEARGTWHKGGTTPGILSRAAVLFDEAVRGGDLRGVVGGALARGLAGDMEGARRRLYDAIDKRPECGAAYMALGVLLLRGSDPLGHATEAAWALVAARDLAPGVPCIERELSIALSAAGAFMQALQSARAALALDPEDVDAKLWAALLRLYFGGDVSSGALLIELPAEAELQHRSPAVWLGAAAGHYARAEFHDARVALRRAIAPLKVGYLPEAPLVDAARRWFREARGFGAGVPMSGERWLRDVGGAHSDYVRTRSALAALREVCSRDPERALADGVDPLEIDGVAGALEARTRRGMLEWGSRLLLRGFAEAYLPLLAYLEAPGPELIAAMDLVLLDG